MREGNRYGRAVVMLGLALLVAALCVGPAALGATDAELAFTKGQDAFQQGDYHEALRHFRRARKADPTRASYAHWEGATLLRLRHYEAALTALEEARELAGSRVLPGWSYDHGVALYQLERYPEAETSLRRALRESPGNHRARFFLGLCLHEQGESEAAIRELRRVRDENPEMGQEAGLVLGRIYAEIGRGDLAAQELRLAADSPDDRVARLSRDYLQQVRVQMGAKPKRWNFSGYSAIEYDTNVVLNPEDPGVDFPVTDSEDWRAEFYGTVQYHPIASARNTFGFTYGFYQSFHEDLTEFDFQGHLPDVHLGLQRGRHGYWGSAGYQFYLLDSNGYLERFEVNNSYSYSEGRSGRTRLYHRYRDDDFDDVPERDGHEHFFGLSQSIFPWQNKRRWLQAGFGYGDRDAGDDFTYDTRAADASFFTPMGEVWYFYATALFTVYDYENPHSVFGTIREDKEWQVSVRTTYELAEHWNLITEYRFTQHTSNIDFFDYKRHIIGIGVTTVY